MLQCLVSSEVMKPCVELCFDLDEIHEVGSFLLMKNQLALRNSVVAGYEASHGMHGSSAGSGHCLTVVKH